MVPVRNACVKQTEPCGLDYLIYALFAHNDTVQIKPQGALTWAAYELLPFVTVNIYLKVIDVQEFINDRLGLPLHFFF